MFSFIPPQFQMAALIGGLFLCTTIGFGAGWAVNGYRLDAAHNKVIIKKDELLHDYDLKLVKQNSAVEQLTYKTWVAEQQYEEAKKRAMFAESLAKVRATKAEEIKPVDCASMVQALKELPK